MPRKSLAPGSTKRFAKLLQRFSMWRGGIGVIILILVLALASRIIGLSSFPYFPPDWPWNGVNGLYVDEYNISDSLFPGFVYSPFLQMTLMSIVIVSLGYTTFAIRLVSAVFSSITSVLVYLSAYELFHKKSVAFLSSLYFIFMTPALIYGRMAFVENGATTFLVATFLFSLKYARTHESRWLTGSAISAGLSFLCKQTGIIAALYLVLFIFLCKPDAIRHLLKYLFITACLITIYVVQILVTNPTYLGNILTVYIGMGIRSADWFNILLTTAMPTGHSLMWHHFPEMLSYFWNIRVDYWYILAYFVIIYLIVKEKETVRGIVLAMSSFILLLIVLGHGNVYYVTLIQPFMAIPMGYGLLKLQKMSGIAAFAFSLLLCFPAVTYMDYYIAYFLIGSVADNAGIVLHLLIVSSIVVVAFLRFCNQKAKREPAGTINTLFLAYYVGWLVLGIYLIPVFRQDTVWAILQFTVVIPMVILGLTMLSYERIREGQRIIINRFFLVFYIACLIIGSYALPVFYPGYFAQSTVTT